LKLKLWEMEPIHPSVGSSVQGCQILYLQTKNPNLGKFWRESDWKMLIYFMSI
jgi:hypothetical protein